MKAKTISKVVSIVLNTCFTSSILMGVLRVALFIDWSWWWICAPFIFATALMSCIAGFVAWRLKHEA